jgi:hypothetical protein
MSALPAPPTPAMSRPCRNCGQPAHLPMVDATGWLDGWLCEPCDRKRRRKQLGWRRRMQLRLRHLFNL